MRWDDGVQWHLDVVTPPVAQPLDVAFVRDSHLRVTNGTDEDGYISTLIAVAARMAERTMRRAVLPQTLELVLNRFPLCAIELPMPPLQSVTSVTYVDADGVAQVLGGSPLPFQVVVPQGPQAPRGCIEPFYGEAWPTARRQPAAVRVRYEAGYPLVGSPPATTMPEDVLHGMLLVIGELYKQRSESVHAFAQNPALVRARDLWLAYRVY